MRRGPESYSPEIEVVPRNSSATDPRAQMKVLANFLDSAFILPGTQIRFGIDALIGLIPGIGDSLGAVISSYIILLAARAGAPRWTLGKMIGNVALETLIGFIPIVGDLFDLVWKANRKNVELFEKAKLDTLSSEEGQKRLTQTLALLIGIGAILIVVTLAFGVMTGIVLFRLLFGA